MEVIQKTKKFVATYARVSTAKQEEDGTIATQLSALKEHADKNGYTIIQEYKDDGWSGDILKRPALDQLRIDAKKKIWDAVLFYDPARLARRYSFQELVMDELRELGIEILFVTRESPRNAEEKILYGVTGLFAEYERTKIAERFRLGKVRKAKEGHIILSEGPYGYDFITRTAERQGYLKINDRESKVVRDIFSWVAKEGLTMRAIVRRLQELGIRPRKSKRDVWNTSTLSTLLRNKTYIGEGHFGASYATVPINPTKKEEYKKIKKTSRRMKPESEWIKITTPAIIDEKLFEKVQKQIKNNFESCIRNRKNDYLLASKIWCSCGNRRTGEGPMHGKHLYYRCSNRVNSFPLASTCTEGGLNARIADDLVWRRAAKLMGSPELLLKQAQRSINEENVKVNTSEIDIVAVRKDITKLKEKEDRYAKAYGDGVFSIDQFKQYAEPIEKEIISLENQVAKAQIAEESQNKAELPKENEIVSFAKQAAQVLGDLNFGLKKEIVNNIIARVIGTQRELVVSGKIDVKYFNHAKFKTINRNSRVAKRWEIHFI